MISVIVPVYNVKDYLEECLDSLVNQTCKDKEIILVDDGSTDGSGRICDSYAEKYKEVRVVHKENGGVSAARNTGIEQASGDSLMFVDADDRIHPQMLQVYEENKNSAWTVISQFSADPSILENAVKLGVKVPSWLVKILKISLKSVDAAGDSITGEKEDNSNG